MLSTPGPSRASRLRGQDARTTATATPQPREERAGTPPLPVYERPIAPLTEVGRNALVALLRSQALRQLKTHVQHAELKLTESAGEVNERLTDATVRLKKQGERERERVRSRSTTEAGDGGENENDGSMRMDVDGGDGEGGKGHEEEIARLKELEERVKSVTEKLDGRMRQAIDSEVRIDALGEVLTGLQRETDAELVANGGARRSRQTRRRTRRAGTDEEEMEEDEGDLYHATPETEEGEDEPSLTRKLEERMAQDQAKWEDLTLTERYSENNNYIGFYRIIHEAKHPGDDPPPVPHASTWFAHLEDPNARSKRRNSSSAPTRRNTRQRQRSASVDSDDLAIERERISLKCPLTLVLFKDPVTSTKCPHSFERAAILAMIAGSSMTVAVPGQMSSSSRRHHRVRAVKCPVCSEVLMESDLREDLVLLRRVRRAEAAQRRDREEEEDAELGFSGRRKSRQNGIMLGSDDEPGVGGSGDEMEIDQVRIKQERARSRGMTQVEDEETDEDREPSAGTASGTDAEEDPNSETASHSGSE
ncbi:zinc-finger of the MIZ type in Nse subunit-domain-containing protein [Aspergillus granulosus]|uniref:Zinc-finger of the MIZ type in Nse subunit-domain-containing protein n=1 Tax=Aspergillus granulosus TaxID=176169 RepID=A0ABR4I2W4_9EURO